MGIEISQASSNDLEYLLSRDTHIDRNLLGRKVGRGELFVIKIDDKHCGLLRYNYFWDEIPFMNLLWLDEGYRGKGFGKEMVDYWENEMKSRGYESVMTSTLQVEPAKDFYSKLGYKVVGSFDIGEGTELILKKIL